MPNSYLARNRLLSLAPPAIDWRWVVKMPTINGAPNPKDIIAETVEFPHFSISALPRFTGAANRYYPGTTDISSAAISFYESETFDTTRYLYTWKTLVIDTNGVYGMPVDYKQNIYLEMYSLRDQLMFKGTLVDTWPMNISPFSLNYNDSGRLTVSCSFSVDGNLIFQNS